MRHIRFLGLISLILGLCLVSFSCITNKNRAANAEFRLAAEAVPEGILLIFSNIPSDATHLWINVQSWGNTEEPEDHQSLISSYAGITDASVQGWVNSTQNLDKVKETGRIIFPIVQTGMKYSITAIVYNEREFGLERESDEYFPPRSAHVNFIAGNGNYFNRSDVRLEINDTHSAVTISSEPVFTSQVTFAEQKYRFSVTILVDNGRSIGVGEHHIPDGLSRDGLTWVFEPQMTESLRRENAGWLETGSYYPAWGTAYVHIIYDDIKWSVEIAKTPEFFYSL